MFIDIDDGYSEQCEKCEHNSNFKQKPKELVTDEQKWINYIKEYCFGGDIEISHSEADKALRLFLISLGYSKLVNIYDKVEKWYA